VKDVTTGTILIATAAGGFGTIGVFGELARLANLELTTLLPARFVFASVGVAIVAYLNNWSIPHSTDQWAICSILGGVYFAMTIAFFLSLEYLPAGLATVLLYIYPAIVALLSVAISTESLEMFKLFALVMSITGVVLIVGIDTGGIDIRGVVLALLAALCYAFYTLGSRIATADVSPKGLSLGILVTTSIWMVGYGFVEGGISMPTEISHWAIIFGLTIISTVIPHLLFYEGILRLEASRVGIISTVEPFVTVALGVLFLNEKMTLSLLCGGALVLGSVIITQRSAS